jgi:putative transposase
MTDDRMVLIEARQKAYDGNFLRALAETVLQIIMDADVEALIGAGRHERSDGRLTDRNGYRDRTLETRLGALNLRIPKLRQGSYFPGLPLAAKPLARYGATQGRARERLPTAGATPLLGT